MSGYEIREVTVADMAAAREARAEKQQAILAKYRDVEKQPAAAISFMLNIPGAVKRTPLFDRAFREGVRRIQNTLGTIRAEILEEVIEEKFTGSEYLAAVAFPALELKREMVKIEEADALGRIFDIDVIGSDARKVERSAAGSEERKCLLCGESAHVCGRNRTHSVAELLAAIEAII